MSIRGEFLSKHFERGFELFADIANSPSFPEAEFAREQKHVLHELAAKEDRPGSVAFELFAKTLWTTHPYRMNPSGERDTVAAMTPATLAAYHRACLTPSQLTLAVVGDVDTQAVLDHAKAAFGGCTRHAQAPAHRRPRGRVDRPSPTHARR